MLSPAGVSSIFAGISPFQQALDFHLERHNLLASNIAHVDTPNYKPQDLARVSATSSFGALLRVSMERTNPAHVGASGTTGEQGRVFTDTTAGGGADGNFVSLDREAGKLASNQLRYDIVSVVVSSRLSGLMNAAGDFKG